MKGHCMTFIWYNLIIVSFEWGGKNTTRAFSPSGQFYRVFKKCPICFKNNLWGSTQKCTRWASLERVKLQVLFTFPAHIFHMHIATLNRSRSWTLIILFARMGHISARRIWWSMSTPLGPCEPCEHMFRAVFHRSQNQSEHLSVQYLPKHAFQ